MIRFVKGRLVSVDETEVVIENQGIGYAVNIPASLMETLPELGEEIRLYTYFSVREDAMQLFGFVSDTELAVFKLLIGVSGIGPKAGLAIIGALGAEKLCLAVMSDDVKEIAKSPGIGPKTAKKVILELKDKIDKIIDIRTLTGGDSQKLAEELSVSQEMEHVIQDAIEALVVLGYQKTEAKKAVEAVEITKEMTVEELLKQSLKHL